METILENGIFGTCMTKSTSNLSTNSGVAVNLSSVELYLVMNGHRLKCRHCLYGGSLPSLTLISARTLTGETTGANPPSVSNINPTVTHKITGMTGGSAQSLSRHKDYAPPTVIVIT